MTPLKETTLPDGSLHIGFTTPESLIQEKYDEDAVSSIDPLIIIEGLRFVFGDNIVNDWLREKLK